MWNLRNKTNEEAERKEIKTQTLKYNEQTGDCQREDGWDDG